MDCPSLCCPIFLLILLGSLLARGKLLLQRRVRLASKKIEQLSSLLTILQRYQISIIRICRPSFTHRKQQMIKMKLTQPKVKEHSYIVKSNYLHLNESEGPRYGFTVDCLPMNKLENIG